MIFVWNYVILFEISIAPPFKQFKIFVILFFLFYRFISIKKEYISDLSERCVCMWYVCVCMYVCVCAHMCVHRDVSVAEGLAWLTGNCGQISAIGSSPSNGLKPNL